MIPMTSQRQLTELGRICVGLYGAVTKICTRNVDIRLPEKKKSNFHGARPVYYNHLDDQADSDQ